MALFEFKYIKDVSNILFASFQNLLSVIVLEPNKTIETFLK